MGEAHEMYGLDERAHYQAEGTVELAPANPETGWVTKTDHCRELIFDDGKLRQ